MEPRELWHAIIDAEAEYEQQHGHPPTLLKLPRVQARELAKLRANDLGELAGRVMTDGIEVFEEAGLLGIPVKLMPGDAHYAFE
jgi:hypothetical protein